MRSTFLTILTHLVTLMGDSMTPFDNSFFRNYCILLLATDISPYNEYIQILMASRDEFCHGNCIFDHFSPFWCTAWATPRPLYAIFFLWYVAMTDKNPIAVDSWLFIALLPWPMWEIYHENCIFDHFGPFGDPNGRPHDPSWQLFCHVLLQSVTGHQSQSILWVYLHSWGKFLSDSIPRCFQANENTNICQ